VLELMLNVLMVFILYEMHITAYIYVT